MNFGSATGYNQIPTDEEKRQEYAIPRKNNQASQFCWKTRIFIPLVVFLCILLLLSFFTTSETTTTNLNSLDRASLPQFDLLGRFIYRNYDTKSPFSSFLPGLAGLWGIPMYSRHFFHRITHF
jgi:hypothetical protein